jgi:uncharacterized protein (TIGR02594 family)
LRREPVLVATEVYQPPQGGFFMENHMAASSYDEALARLLVHEGGNDDDPRDPGGRTSRGILQREWDVWRRSHPGLPADVWRAPQDQVEAIYRQNYWNALRCDDLPAGVDYAVFDYGVNSGIGRAAKVLQRLVATAVDGEVGPDTVAATKRASAPQVIEAICDERLAFLQGLRTWPTFGKGWGRRVREVRAAALAMVAAPPSPQGEGPARRSEAAKPAAPPAVAPAAVPARGASSSAKWFASLGRAIAGLFMRASGQRGDSMVRAHSASEDARARADDTRPEPGSSARAASDVTPPPWLAKAESYLGFHERPGNRGIEEFIALAKSGSIGDPWCAIFVNACLEAAGVRGTRSAMARSFERDGNFVKLAGPALGAVTTMWRGSPSSGSGHVFFYLGENDKGVLALGGNQSDQVCRQYEPRERVTGYWWPRTVPLPRTGKFIAKESGARVGGTET